jgi:L-serine dehydratase
MLLATDRTSERTHSSRPISVTELFTIGVGPSSSHTVGPMRAAFAFAKSLLQRAAPVQRIECDLYGSLALTGRGHATDVAIMLGLAGWQPEQVEPDAVPGVVAAIRTLGQIALAERTSVRFSEDADLRFRRETFLPFHPNALELTATLADGSTIARRYYSIGGGAIVEDGAKPSSRPSPSLIHSIRQLSCSLSVTPRESRLPTS